MKIFYALLSIYGISHLYVFICLRRAFGGGIWQLPAIIWLAAMSLGWILRFGRPGGPIGVKFQDLTFFWMGFLIMLCYCLIAFDLSALLSRALSLITGAEPLRRLSSFLVASRYVPLALILAAGLYCYSLYEAQTPRIREIALATPKLPASSPPLRIAGIADVHLSSLIGPWMLQRMADRISELKPDILVISGDLVDTNLSGRDKDAAILRAIPARLGKFAVTGNHEFYRGLEMSLEFMRKSGLKVLRGEAAEVGGIIVAGVDDASFAGRSAQDNTDISRVLAALPRDRFILLLNHQPSYPESAVGRFDLLFSGHTHGGQFWPGGLVTRRIYRAEQGLNVLRKNGKESLLYITNGIGFWGPPIRFLAPPEVTLITLSPENSSP